MSFLPSKSFSELPVEPPLAGRSLTFLTAIVEGRLSEGLSLFLSSFIKDGPALQTGLRSKSSSMFSRGIPRLSGIKK